MLPTIMNRGPIDPWTRTPRSVAPSSTWAASYLRPSSAAFITTIAESSFQYTQFKTNCPTYQTLTPTGRVEAMEKRLDVTLGAAKTVQPALAKFYDSLSDEQKARLNSLRSASRPAG